MTRLMTLAIEPDFVDKKNLNHDTRHNRAARPWHAKWSMRTFQNRVENFDYGDQTAAQHDQRHGQEDETDGKVVQSGIGEYEFTWRRRTRSSCFMLIHCHWCLLVTYRVPRSWCRSLCMGRPPWWGWRSRNPCCSWPNLRWPFCWSKRGEGRRRCVRSGRPPADRTRLTWMTSCVNGSVMTFSILISPPPDGSEPMFSVIFSLTYSRYPTPHAFPNGRGRFRVTFGERQPINATHFRRLRWWTAWWRSASWTCRARWRRRRRAGTHFGRRSEWRTQSCWSPTCRCWRPWWSESPVAQSELRIEKWFPEVSARQRISRSRHFFLFLASPTRTASSRWSTLGRH